MRHEDAFERLIGIVTLPSDGHVEGVDAAVLAHAARCPVCAARIATLTRLDRSLLGAARDHRQLEEPTRELGRRVLAIPSTERRTARRRFRPAALAMTAAAIAITIAIAIAIPPRIDSGTPRTAAVSARTIPLRASTRSIAGSVTLGSLAGTIRTVRLTADGLATGSARSYSVWLTGPDGSVLIRSFSANPGGACDVSADAPEGRWNRIAITINGQPPADKTTLATAKI